MNGLKLGMIGGGKGAMIGAVHRMAAQLDGKIAFVAGALSSTPEKSRASGKELGLADDRNYGTWQEMLQREQQLPPGQRIDFVTIATPNHLHYQIAKPFVLAGFNVVLDKPMVLTSAQAQELVDVVDRAQIVFAVMYNYCGYPLVRQAAAMVRGGELGTIRKVVVHYHQGWLATRLEATGQKQAAWRTDPKQAGISGAVGDIGSHAENLLSFVTGLTISELCADLSAFVPGRALDDDAAILLRLPGGARGLISCSQICVGEENNLTIAVYGETGSLRWAQERPNELHVMKRDQPRQIMTRAGAGLDASAKSASRLPPGHPEDFIGAFANIYAAVADAITAKDDAESSALVPRYPTVRDGARGVRFIEACVRSSDAGGSWARMEG